jgi:hypothetical protein
MVKSRVESVSRNRSEANPRMREGFLENKLNVGKIFGRKRGEEGSVSRTLPLQ